MFSLVLNPMKIRVVVYCNLRMSPLYLHRERVIFHEKYDCKKGILSPWLRHADSDIMRYNDVVRCILNAPHAMTLYYMYPRSLTLRHQVKTTGQLDFHTAVLAGLGHLLYYRCPRKRNPLSDADTNISHCTYGAPHIHILWCYSLKRTPRGTLPNIMPEQAKVKGVFSWLQSATTANCY